ncbi:MAG: signal peptidase II [Verrucomicrobia bacterium]|nr:signal peptidase II [Verrucomicrobiota bacterium]
MSELSAPPPASTTHGATPAPRLQRIFAYRWLLGLALGVFLLDQITKFLIVMTLPTGTYGPPRHIPIISGFFNLVHVGNTGAAWSLFAGKSTMLALLALITLAAIFLWRRSLGLRLLPVQVSFGLLCGGIVGNLLDRLVYGHVIDFLDFHFGSYIYPTFNIADSGICVGVGIYLWYSFTNPTLKEPANPASTQT